MRILLRSVAALCLFMIEQYTQSTSIVGRSVTSCDAGDERSRVVLSHVFILSDIAVR